MRLLLTFAAMLPLTIVLAATLTAQDKTTTTGAVVPVPRPKAPEWTEVKCEPGVPIPLTVPEAKSVQWILVDETLATLTTVPDSTAAVFNAPRPARCRVIAIADGKPHLTMMVAGEPPPGPPGPPGPTPVPPKPVDELTQQLQLAYQADSGATKAADLRQLIALYAQCVEFANSTDVSTPDELFGRVSKAAATLLPDVDGVRRLAGLRKIIAAELNAIIPADPDAPLTATVRETAAKTFAKFSKALQGVNP